LILPRIGAGFIIACDQVQIELKDATLGIWLRLRATLGDLPLRNGVTRNGSKPS
jgi:hypothetical protein